MRAAGRLSTRPSSTAWVSASIQWRSSKTTRSGWTWLSRSRSRLTASQRALAALRRVEGLPVGVLDGDVEQREKRRQQSA